VAIFPDPVTTEKLDALTISAQNEHVGSRRMQRAQLHLTLAFIGQLEDSRAELVARMLDAMPADPFFWTLDRVGGFERARVLWAGGKDEPRLKALARMVRRGLDAEAVHYDRKPFSAHVTLLRNVTRVSGFLLAAPIAWHVTRPRLVVSERSADGDIRYRCWDGRPLL
jgi:2'-5' RNA ligase